MTKINLANQGRERILFGKDSVVIQKYFSGIKGGRSLDVAADFPLAVISAGHVIITDCNGTYKPMPVKAKSGYTYTKVTTAGLYEAIADPTGENPYSNGWYTESGGAFTQVGSGVTTPAEGVTYYKQKNPKTEGWFTEATGVYTATNDQTPQVATDYYIRTGNEIATDADGNTVYEYDSLPANYAYAGVLYRSVKKTMPLAAIMTNGEVNSEALDIAMTGILSAFQSACPHIVFIKDEAEEEE